MGKTSTKPLKGGNTPKRRPPWGGTGADLLLLLVMIQTRRGALQKMRKQGAGGREDSGGARVGHIWNKLLKKWLSQSL